VTNAVTAKPLRRFIYLRQKLRRRAFGDSLNSFLNGNTLHGCIVPLITASFGEAPVVVVVAAAAAAAAVTDG